MSDTKQRLSGLDWQFLGIEDKSSTHMHIGSLLTLEGPAPGQQELRDFVESRIGQVPRFRERVISTSVDAGKPYWVDDPDFRIDEHIVAVALPAPGSREDLERLTGEVFSTRLDRNRPLWRMWYVEGLPGDQWALIMKMHHCMVDGLGALDLFAALLDLTPEPRIVEQEEYDPEPLPGKRDAIAEQARRMMDRASGATKTLTSMISNPDEAGPKIMEVAKGMVETAQAALPLPVNTPLNVETGPLRGFSGTNHSLTEYKSIKNDLGGTVNDVVLEVAADALGRYLRHLGMSTDGLEIRAEIPSSVRSKDEGGDKGNIFVVLAVQLPVDEMPPPERYEDINDRMRTVKQSGISTAVGTILKATDFLPPTLLAQTSRLVFGKQLFNVLISNVPGVQFPVYMNGSRLIGLSPLPWVGPQQALSVACISYNGTLSYGFMYDREVVTDGDVVAQLFDDAFDDLKASVTS